MSLPSVTFDATKSLFAGLSIISYTPTGGSAKNFGSKKLDHKLSQEVKHIERPDSTGVMRTVRTVLTKCEESFEYEIDEAKRVLSDLFGGALAGVTTGNVTIWEPDPADASGNVALKSASFPCTIVRNGDLKFGDGNLTTAQITIHANVSGPVTWTADGAA